MSTKKTQVVVTLRSETAITMEVEHDDDEDPCDLTKEERVRARTLAGVDTSWDVIDVEVARS